jgi:Rieske 2Fe-2S family protein
VLVVAPARRLAAHYNVCRHRRRAAGAECRTAGFSGAIRCPYHSWTYALEGAPHGAFLEDDGLSRDELSLHPVGVDTWGGFVFVHLEPAEAMAQAGPRAAQLGGVDRVRRYPLARLRAAARSPTGSRPTGR